MRTEFQISKLNELVDDLNIQNIVIGSEGCIYNALRNEYFNIAKLAAERQLRIRFITPFVPDKYMEQIYEKIERLSELSQIKVTFNEFGLLNKCKELIESSKIIPVLGRMLTRSIIDCPWYDELLQDEEGITQQAVLGYNFKHESKIRFLKKYHIEEIEINYNKNFSEELEYFNNNGIEITCHSNMLLSIGRVCFTAKCYEMTYPTCLQEELCNKTINISLVKGWNHNQLVNQLDSDISKVYRNMYFKCNIVYQKCKITKDALVDNKII